MYLQVLILLVSVMAAALPMPIDHEESTTEITTLFISSSELDAATTDNWLETTTTSSSEDDLSLESPSQTIEIRLHPQLLHPEQLKSLPTTTETAVDETTTSIATILPTANEDVKKDRQQTDSDHFQPAHGIFGTMSGRFRLKDTIGAALRRAITGTPVVHKLQHFPARTRHGASISRTAIAAATGLTKDGEITPRRISFGNGALSSNLPGATRFAFDRHHAKLGKHRSPSGIGETPAGTRVESNHDWLYVAHNRDAKRPIDNFRIPSTERWFVFGARAERTTTTTVATTTEMDEAISTTTSTSATSMTTVPHSTEAPALSSTNESGTTTLTPTPALSGITPEINYATPETVHATPESVHAQPEIDYGMPEVNHGTPETNYGNPEVQYGRPEADFVDPRNHDDHLPSQPSNRELNAAGRGVGQDATDESTGTTFSLVTESTTPQQGSEMPMQLTTTKTESNSVPLTKAIGPVISITLAHDSIENIKELTNSPLDGEPPVSQGLEPSPVDDDEDYGEEQGTFMGNLDNNETDPDAHKYLVEEKTPDGYIVGEFGVISRSSGSLRGVRYTAHGSINPQLIQDALRTFLSLK